MNKMKPVPHLSTEEMNKLLALLPKQVDMCLRDYRWVLSQPIQVILQYESFEKSIYFEQKSSLKKTDPIMSTECISLVAKLNAACSFRAMLHNPKDVSMQTLALVDELNIECLRKTKEKPKQQKLKNIQSTIVTMLRKGESLRAMTEIIRQRHRFDVSHTTLQAFIKENIREVKNG